jgi:uroporphyrinogen decarboxylase
MTTQISRGNGATDFGALPLSETQAIVARFEEKVNAAQRALPPSKEAVRKALRRKGAGRCPVRMKRLSMDVIVRYGDALADLFCSFPDDVIHVQPYEFSIGYQASDHPNRLNELQILTQPGEWRDEWGTRWGHASGGVGATPVDYPLKDWSQLDDYLRRRMPDPHLPGRLDAARAVLAIHGESKYCVGVIHLVLFERLHCLRGMGNVFMDLCTNEAEICRLLEALSDYAVALVREWAPTPASALFLTDDWGSQTSLMISLPMWRKYFKPHYRRIFDEIHRAGKDVIFHSCGNVAPIIPELIDLGVDVLDPLQPEAMDLADIARRFGGQLAFCGGITDQRLEDFTSQEVRNMVRQAIETLGVPFRNAYVVAPSNVLPPSVTFENLAALLEACHAQ